ncbi:MAG TPA: methyltransferase domain-containing protein [Acidobacteriota bacterium]|nr:methyltransferase domain-containing protein [Acidobacteriota bacterium]
MKKSFGLSAIWFFSLAIAVPYSSGQRTKEQIEKIHQDPKAYIAMLDNPQRDKEQRPDEVLAALDLKPGETIADIGAGSGYFSFRFARKLGDTGRVYAVDINSDMILHMNRYIRDNRLKNVTTILSAPDDPLLMDASINRFFICNTWHHIQNRPQYVARMKKMLKPGGQIIIIDYKKKQLPVGPPPEMKLAKREVIAEMEAGGFKLAKEHGFLEYQYFLIFTAK